MKGQPKTMKRLLALGLFLLAGCGEDPCTKCGGHRVVTGTHLEYMPTITTDMSGKTSTVWVMMPVEETRCEGAKAGCE